GAVSGRAHVVAVLVLSAAGPARDVADPVAVEVPARDALGSGRARVARRACRPGAACRPDVARRALRSRRSLDALRAGRSGAARWALRSRRSLDGLRTRPASAA